MYDPDQTSYHARNRPCMRVLDCNTKPINSARKSVDVLHVYWNLHNKPSCSLRESATSSHSYLSSLSPQVQQHHVTQWPSQSHHYSAHIFFLSLPLKPIIPRFPVPQSHSATSQSHTRTPAKTIFSTSGSSSPLPGMDDSKVSAAAGGAQVLI